MSEGADRLWVIMPVYNERVALASVVKEWLPVLREQVKDFTLCVLNDGSTDDSLQIARRLAESERELLVVDKPNSGHGQTCLVGYREALKAGAQWIFQIDSDGQCAPEHFAQLWAMRREFPLIYGYRKTRDDGRARWLISRVVSLVTYLATGARVKDPNVPYRLMRADKLRGLCDEIQPDFHLANIMLAALQQQRFGIHWVTIHFRQRQGGKAAVKSYAFARQGLHLFVQLRTQLRRSN